MGALQFSWYSEVGDLLQAEVNLVFDTLAVVKYDCEACIMLVEEEVDITVCNDLGLSSLLLYSFCVDIQKGRSLECLELHPDLVTEWLKLGFYNLKIVLIWTELEFHSIDKVGWKRSCLATHLELELVELHELMLLAQD